MEIMKNQQITSRGISIRACGIRHLKSAHFYTGVPPVSALCEAPACRIRMRTGRRSGESMTASPRSGQGRCPCAAMRLSRFMGSPIMEKIITGQIITIDTITGALIMKAITMIFSTSWGITIWYIIRHDLIIDSSITGNISKGIPIIGTGTTDLSITRMITTEPSITGAVNLGSSRQRIDHHQSPNHRARQRRSSS